MPETETTENRERAIAMLRAMADLMESDPDLPLPTGNIAYYVAGSRIADVPGAVAEAIRAGERAAIITQMREAASQLREVGDLAEAAALGEFADMLAGGS